MLVCQFNDLFVSLLTCLFYRRRGAERSGAKRSGAERSGEERRREERRLEETRGNERKGEEFTVRLRSSARWFAQWFLTSFF